MRRRDISKALFATAAGSTVVAQRAEAQSCTAPCYVQTAGEIAAGVTPVNYAYPPGWISRYGTNSVPGTTDMSAAIMNAVNANAGGRIYIDSLCLAAGIILTEGAIVNGQPISYTGTEIVCVGSGELLFKPNGGIFNFKGYLWALILVQGCNRVLLDLRINGNRSAMTESEWIYAVAFMGSTNCYCPSPKIREVRGDGLYIDWYDPTQSTGQANSHNIMVDYLNVYNTANDGRNACSVVSCNVVNIGQLTSYQVGGVVGGLEPGGLDLEPAWPAQSITDVVIGNVNVTNGAATGISMAGMSISGNDANMDWNISRVNIQNARLYQTGGGNFLMDRVSDATVQIDQINTGYGFGGQIDNCNRVNVVYSVTKVTQGLILGFNGFVYDSNITAYINDYGNGGFGGIVTCGVGRTTIKGKLYNAANPSLFPLGVQLTNHGRSGIAQTGVVYSIDFPYDPNLYACFYDVGVAIGTGTMLLNCTMAGFPFAYQTTFQIPSYNCVGRNIGTGSVSAPSSGYWNQFDEVVLDQIMGATAPRSKCIAGGNPGTWILYANMGP